MTLKQQKIEKLQQQILNLQEKIRQLEAMPTDYDELERLENFSDFPGFTYKPIFNAICRLTEQKGSPKLHIYQDEITIKDLISLTPDELLRQRGIGPQALEKLQNWMNLYGLQFINV